LYTSCMRRAGRILLICMACAAVFGCGESSTAEPQAAPPDRPAPSQQPDQDKKPVEQLGSLDGRLPEEFARLTDTWTGDLDGMLERHVVRALVVGGGPQFFYYNGMPRGIVAELLVALQAELNDDLDRRYRQLEVIPMPVSRDRLIPALVGGRADLIAADLTVTDRRSEQVDFSSPFVTNIDEIVVFRPGHGSGIRNLEGLSGHNVLVRQSSSYFEHLVELNTRFERQGIDPIRIDAANELLRSQDILEMVNAGLADATVIDEWKANYWSRIFPVMQARNDLVIHEGGDLAWAIRKDSPLMKAAIDKFAKGHRQGTLIGNVLIKRYVENLHWVRNATSDSEFRRLEPVFDAFRESGEKNGLDPLMLVAQAYQESQLDNEKVSPAGARGMMQIKPSTAADPNVGIPDISSPTNNIAAGARYMRFLMDRYFSGDDIDELQSWFFALAAYNAGPARIMQLRRRALDEGHDPDIWVDNVELAAERVIGRETVRYVRNVFKYYVAYRMAFEERRLRETVEYNR
jgi:membrane-bound lytic murein transglycosylase MltF